MGRFKDDIYWYRYIYPKNLTLFHCEKLVAPEISLGGNFAYDKNGEFYSTTKVYGYIKKATIKESYLFWLGIFNSNLFWHFIKQTGYVLRGGYYTFKTNYILPFPVPQTIPECICKSIELHVEEILKLKKKNDNSSGCKPHEESINHLVYELYGMSAEEVRKIEDEI